MVSSDECGGICNTIDDPSSRICVPNKADDENLNVFNMIKEKNESKSLIKYISCQSRCNFDERECNSKQK